MSGAVPSYQQKDPMIIIDSKSLPIPVLATGKGWLVVDKPAGITVHNEPGRDVCSLASAFIQKEPSVLTQIDMDSDFRVNPVHRLDKETSGIILLAATPEMFRFFSKQFESRQANKLGKTPGSKDTGVRSSLLTNSLVKDYTDLLSA